MQKLITIEDVNLKSMAVEIKALTVNGKQMTLSVFRQLPHLSIWDNMFEQIGTPWGRVLYFWGNNKDCNGFQVVWQKGDQLFRSVHWVPHIENICRRDADSLETEIYELEQQSFKYYKPDTIREKERVSRIMAAKQELECSKKARDNKFLRLKAAYAMLEQLPQLFIAM